MLEDTKLLSGWIGVRMGSGKPKEIAPASNSNFTPARPGFAALFGIVMAIAVLLCCRRSMHGSAA